MSDFPFETTLSVRYQDLDALGHVNNAVYATYLEQARLDFFADDLGFDTDATTMVVAHLELDFEAPLVDARHVTVGIAPVSIGEKSFTLTYEVRDGETVVASGETVQVWIDRKSGAAVELPEPVRSALDDVLVSTPN